MMRLFLDANVLFTAAHNPGGKASLLIELWQAGHFEVVTCNLCVEEAERNLHRKYPEAVPAFRALLVHVALVPDARGEGCPLPLPEKDRPVLAAALRCGADRLLTGDVRHFGPFMDRPPGEGPITIRTVARFLASL